MRSTPRNVPITMSGVTDPSAQPPQQPDPSGGFYYQQPPQYQQPPPQPPNRGMSSWAIVGISVAVFAVLACVGGAVLSATGGDKTPGGVTVTDGPEAATGTHEATTAPTAKTAQLGQTLIFTGAFGGTEIHYTLAADKTYTTSTRFDLKPEKGVFFAVAATIEAKKGSAFATPIDFALIAADGTVYEPSGSLGFANALETTQINEGQRKAGLVVFDVPQAALAKAKIELRADFFSSGDAGYWQLP